MRVVPTQNLGKSYICILYHTVWYSLWQDGVLIQLLMKDSSLDQSSVRDATQWFVLEGNLSTVQFDSLLSYLGPKSSLTLSNGRTVQLKDSIRFILEVSMSGYMKFLCGERLEVNGDWGFRYF